MYSAERRRYPRFAIAAPASLSVSGYEVALPAALANLGVGGCFVATKAVVRAGWSAVVRLRAGAVAVEAAGAVVRDEAGVGFAVEFARTDEAFRGFVGALAAAREGERAQVLDLVGDVAVEVAPGAARDGASS